MSDERTYRAARLDAALGRIKRDLGADAVILDWRKVGDGVEVRAVESARAVEERAPSSLPRRDEPCLLQRLLERNGLDPGLARILATTVPDEPRTLGEASAALTRALRVHAAFRVPDLTGGRRVLAFVGPTGVGKTTTLAKVAARSALVDRRRVGLVSLDAYRIGATDQLERYADLIGVPMEVARDRPSFERALRRLADAQVILVDTEGRAPRDRGALGRLAETLHGGEEDVDVNLCLSAVARDLELADAAERHALLRPRTLTVTKLDEALQQDAVMTAHIMSGLPLAFFTTGQRVPEDLLVAAPERLAAALCGGELHGREGTA